MRSTLDRRVVFPVHGQPRRMISVALTLLLLSPVTLAAQGVKKPITQSMYDSVRSVFPTLTADGKWVIYRLARYQTETSLVVRATSGSTERKIPLGYNPPDFTVSMDGRYLIYQVAPAKSVVD